MTSGMYEIRMDQFHWDDEEPPQIGDILNIQGMDTVVMGTTAADGPDSPGNVTVQPLYLATPPEWLNNQADQMYRAPQPNIQPMLPWSPAPEHPDWYYGHTTRTYEPQRSAEWYRHHGMALAKMMELYTRNHTEPLHELPATELGYMTEFAQMYADAKESGLFECWDYLKLGVRNPFEFLEQELASNTLTERLPRRIVLRRRSE